MLLSAALLFGACSEKQETVIPVTGVSLNLPSSLNLLIGATLILDATVEPAEATNQTVTWSTDDDRIASVSPEGVLTAVATGTTTITVSAGDGRFTATSAITVTDGIVHVTGVTLNPPDAVLLVGATLVLDATVEPADATNQTITWSSDDDRVATVSMEGVLTAKATGTATIIVTTVDGRYTASSTITVDEQNITMTTKASEVNLRIDITAGYLNIDWGDGDSYSESGAGAFNIFHNYSSASEYRITITGNHIERLVCQSSFFTALDVSKYPALKELYCYANILTALDVSKNTYLEVLWCPSYSLTTLDVSKNTALRYLLCSHNQLTALDVSRNTALKGLYCNNNQLSTLDVSMNTALTVLNCGNNALIALDVSENTAIEALSCYNNQLTALDVSKNTALIELDVSKNLLTASELNNLFRTLPYVIETGADIDIENNSGTLDCDRSIAKGKGWFFNDFHYIRSVKLNMNFLNYKSNKK